MAPTGALRAPRSTSRPIGFGPVEARAPQAPPPDRGNCRGRRVGGLHRQRRGERRPRQRAQALRRQQCGTLPHPRRGRDHRRGRPRPRRGLRRRRATRGIDSDTIEGVVDAQIENPRDTDPENTRPTCPPKLVTRRRCPRRRRLRRLGRRRARHQAAEGPRRPRRPGLRQQRLRRLPRLAAAGSSGTVGPNLDEVLPGQSAAMITQSRSSIPPPRSRKGFPDGIMPANYGTRSIPRT